MIDTLRYYWDHPALSWFVVKVLAPAWLLLIAYAIVYAVLKGSGH